MRNLPPLGSMRAFEAAARRESFKLAAIELGVTPTAISHQIRQLEETLGVSLFVRQTRKVTLTEVGRDLYAVLRKAFDEISTAVKSVRRRPLRQVATLSATVAFTAKLLVPHAASFRELHPGWDLRLDARDDPIDLLAGDADAAIRYGLGHYPGLQTVPLLADTFAPVCSPYLNCRTIEALPGATLIHFDWGPGAKQHSVPTWRLWAKTAGLTELIDVDAGITFSDESSAIQAAIAGQGVALLSRTLVGRELASGALIEPFGPTLEGLRYDFVFPIGAETQAPVTVLRDWVLTKLFA